MIKVVVVKPPRTTGVETGTGHTAEVEAVAGTAADGAGAARERVHTC